MIRKKILQELECLGNKSSTVATIGMTARKSSTFTILPRRKTFGFESINFLVSTEEAAKECLTFLDGKVHYILVDVEAKQNVKLESIANNIVAQSCIIPYKPNDTTLEATDLFLLRHFKSIRRKTILIYGAGNLGTKLALRLAERGGEIYMLSRDYNKVELICKALNLILPKYSDAKMIPIRSVENFTDYFDAIISFISAEKVIPSEIIHSLKEEALVIDGGVNNFTSEFYEKSSLKDLCCFRVDVRAGFLYSLLPIDENVDLFFSDIQGVKKLDDNVKLISGGIIGRDGDIVVDHIKYPNQVIGVANGIGGIKSRAELSIKDLQNLRKVSKEILKN